LCACVKGHVRACVCGCDRVFVSQVWLWVERDVGHGTVECGSHTYRNVMEMRSVVDQKVNEVVIGNTICGTRNGWVIPLVTIWKVLRADKGTWENWGTPFLGGVYREHRFDSLSYFCFPLKEAEPLGKACSLLAHVECREREGTKHKPVPGANLLCHRHFLQLAVWIQNQKKSFGSNPNVILMRQTCGQRSGMAVESKCRGLAFYFSIPICYLFPLSKCRGKWDPGLCMTSGLVKGMPLRSGKFWRILRSNTFKNRKSALHSRILFASPEFMHRSRSGYPLHFDIRNI